MQFPKVLRAVKAGDGSQWKIGDALIAECGPPPKSGDVGRSRPGRDLTAVEVALAAEGFEYAERTLAYMRVVASQYPPERRTVDAPFAIYAEVAAGTADMTPAQREKKLWNLVNECGTSRAAIRKALGRRTGHEPDTATVLANTTVEQRREIARSVLADEDEAEVLLTDRKTRINVAKARAAVEDATERNVRARIPDVAASRDRDEASRSLLASLHAMKRAIRQLEGVRMTNMLRDEIEMVSEEMTLCVKFLADLATTRGTVGDEAEAFLASLQEEEK